MASFEKRGGKIRALVCKSGVRATKTCDTMKEAKEWAALKEAEIIEGKKKKKVKTAHTVQTALIEFRENEVPDRGSERPETMRCNFMLKSLPFTDAKIDKVGTEDIQEWVDDRTNTVKGSTVNRDLNFLSAFFEYVRKRKWIDVNPVHEVERPSNPKPRNRRIGEPEVTKMMAALSYTRGTIAVSERERVALSFLLAIETGMRRGEMLSLTWPHVHADYVHLVKTKNGDSRNVPLSPAAIVLIGLLPRDPDSELCFGGLTSVNAEKIWRTERDRVGVENLHFHDSRHEAVTRLARKLDILDLAAMIGHRDINSLKVYYNPTPSEIAARLAA